MKRGGVHCFGNKPAGAKTAVSALPAGKGGWVDGDTRRIPINNFARVYTRMRERLKGARETHNRGA